MNRASGQVDRARGERPVMVVGAGVMVRGDVQGVTDLHVHGQIVGKVVVADLVIEAHGLIDGPVTADDVTVSGCVLGPVDAKAVHLRASARVDGDVTCESIQIEPGARFAGRCISKEPPKDKVVPLFRKPETASAEVGPVMADAAEELLRLAARLRQLRE